MKKVVICASASLQKEIKFWEGKLIDDGYEVIKAPEVIKKINFLSEYKNVHAEHYKKIKESDILFVLNINKNGVKNYIGPSVFAEIAFAIGLDKSFNKNIKIYCLNSLPLNLGYSDELKLWHELGWINIWEK